MYPSLKTVIENHLMIVKILEIAAWKDVLDMKSIKLKIKINKNNPK